MNYSNGLSNLQHLLGNIAVNAARTAKATPQTGANTDYSTTGSSVLDNLDGAQLSSVSGLVGQALSGSDVRLYRVVALQAAIGDGTYNVSSSDIAGSVIDSLLNV